MLDANGIDLLERSITISCECSHTPQRTRRMNLSFLFAPPISRMSEGRKTCWKARSSQNCSVNPLSISVNWPTMPWLIQRGIKRSYRTDVPRFASLKEWFGVEPAEELTPREIEHKLARAAEKEKWAPSTFNHYRSLMSLSYRLGILNRKVTTNPARSVTHRREDNNRVRFLTEDEEKKLRKIIQAKWPSHIPEFDLAINTGLRKGSQYGLTWDMVDWKSRMLNISRTKNDEAVHVLLNDAAVAALKTVFERGDGRGRVFRSSKRGEPLENARHWFDDAVAEAKLKSFHWHDLRATFASRLRMKGAPLEDIADLLGHKSLTMTRRYAHLGPNRLHEVVSLLKATDAISDTEQMAVSSTIAQVSVN
jgi:integrase